TDLRCPGILRPFAIGGGRQGGSPQAVRRRSGGLPRRCCRGGGTRSRQNGIETAGDRAPAEPWVKKYCFDINGLLYYLRPRRRFGCMVRDRTSRDGTHRSRRAVLADGNILSRLAEV